MHISVNKRVVIDLDPGIELNTDQAIMENQCLYQSIWSPKH